MNKPSSPPDEDELLRERILGTEADIHVKTWYPRLKGALAELRLLNSELEARIDERTEELKGANERLGRANEELGRANEELENKNRELEASRERLIEAERLAERGRLMGQVAHELNTPLGALISASENLAEEAGIATLRTVEIAERSYSGERKKSELLLRLVKDGLSSAKRYPAAINGNGERKALLRRLRARLQGDGLATRDAIREAIRDDLDDLGYGPEIEDGLLDAVISSPETLHDAVLLTAPSRSAAIARASAELAARAISLLLSETKEESVTTLFRKEPPFADE